MFRPENLVRVTIQVPEDHISEVTAALAQFRLLHLIKVRDTHLGHMGYVAKVDKGLLNELEQVSRQIENTLDSLGVARTSVPSEETLIPETEIHLLRERLETILRQVTGVLESARETERNLAEQSTLLRKFQLLPRDLDLSRLAACTFVRWTAGLVPGRSLDKLEESLAEVQYACIHVGTFEQRAVILVFGLVKDWSVFERALKGAFFEEIEIPSQVSGMVGPMIDELERRVEELESQKQRVYRERDALKEKFASELLMLRERAIVCRQILSARQFFGKVDKGAIITGWIPVRLVDSLRGKLAAVTNGQMAFDQVNPEDLREVRGGIVRIPILLNNPLLMRPFEKLTDLYGTPKYKEIEPTVLFALGFLLMFGMMFGDIGHGVVLFLLGYVVFRRMYKYTDYGVILMECGAVSAIFGLLYGSVFGIEDLLPALWFKPMDHITYLVKVALLLGIVLVSVGMILNVINAIRLKEYEDLLGAGGAAGAVFYWMLVGLGVKYALTGRLPSKELVFFGWSAAGLLTVMIFHRPLYRWLFRKGRLRTVIGGKGFFTELLESVIESLDDLLRYLANTISFIRVAAFALAHAALFIAVFSVAEALAADQGGGISYWVVLVVGNALIILLEGLVVSIQVIRLQYYEFFSKFFRGGGEKFIPFDREIESGIKRG